MSEPERRPLNIVCMATYFKGTDFIRECKAHGCNVILVTKEKMLNEDWPRESLADLIAVPNDAGPALFIDLVAFLSRKAKLDRVIALEEFDVITAALIREHLCLPGLSSSGAKVFRDKMAMAIYSSKAGIDVPEFVPLINPDEVSEFMERVPGPWVIKPRSDVSAIGIRKVEEAAEVWAVIEELNARESLVERASYYLLALGINRILIKALGLQRGATHAEFIKSTADEKLYFLEVASRVGGAYIADVLEAASGINLWREWAKIEITDGAGVRSVTPLRKEYAGIILSLAKQESPDTSGYTDSEIVYRVKKRHHAGIIVRSPRLERVTELLDDYGRRFVDDFVAVVAPPERPE